MTAGSTIRRRFQFSIRSLLVVTGLLALLLTPVAWMVRQRELMRQAREDALRAVMLERQYRAEQQKRYVDGLAAIDRSETRLAPQRTPSASSGTAADLEQLRRENAELRNTVEALEREIRRMKEQVR
jgi:cell division protein FtsB